MIPAFLKVVPLLIFPGMLYVVTASLLIAWLDRVLVARWQGRVGPPWFQPIADFLKLLFKEDVTPSGTARASEWLPILGQRTASVSRKGGNHKSTKRTGAKA